MRGEKLYQLLLKLGCQFFLSWLNFKRRLHVSATAFFPYFFSLCKEVVLLVVKAVCILLRKTNQTASTLSPQDLWGVCFRFFLFVFKVKLESSLTVGHRSEEKEAPPLFLWAQWICSATAVRWSKGEESSRGSKWKITFEFQNKLVANRRDRVLSRRIFKMAKRFSSFHICHFCGVGLERLHS